MSLKFTQPTALLLIDSQKGFDTDPNTPCHWGTQRSNPSLKKNLSALLTAFRNAKAKAKANGRGHEIEIIHVFHSSLSPTSALHPSAENGTNIQPLEITIPAPDGSEPIFWKHVNSAFIGTNLESYLREHGVRQLIVAGITTDHCVSTSVRMAANLGVVDRYPGGLLPVVNQDGSQRCSVPVDKGRIVLVGDATATWAKGGFDAETVHAVTLASLDEEFADVLSTEVVLGGLQSLE
ncbi:Isochorismatase-like protein [Aspergillus cavernicola]|uniref:Isochorismatase-like protein n=1 Tax=Aspergillus cavernicola TaxID=176166 RepID=A0ABR4I8E6_9EURO